MNKVLKDKTTAESLTKEIKDAIGETELKTADFVQAIINDAGIERAKSVKSPAKLVELWKRRELSFGSLRFHLKAVRQKAPSKVVKVKTAKATKGKRGRKAKPVIMIEADQKSFPFLMAA
jgi:hypothetical protein